MQHDKSFLYDSLPLFMTVKRFFSPQTCEHLITWLERDEGKHWFNHGMKSGSFYNETPTQMVSPNNEEPILRFVFDLLTQGGNAAAQILGLEIDGDLRRFHATRWDVGKTYGRHHDSDLFKRQNHRDTKLSFYVSLCDAGGLHLDQIGWIPCDKGDALAFMAFTNHSINDKREQPRHSLVSWFEGPRWR